MRTSLHLEQALFYSQSPATDQFFETRSEQLFEVSGGGSSIEIHVQLPSQAKNPSELRDGLEVSDEEYENSPTPTAPLPIDWCHYLRATPPGYDGTPGLRWQKVMDPDKLRKIEFVNIFAASPNT